MRLLEVFNRPVQSSERRFYIDGDGPYEVQVYDPSDYLDAEAYEWMESQDPDSVDRPNVVGVHFFYKNSGSITNAKQPFKVFATVINIVSDLVKTHRINFVTFTAKETEPSRVRLYHRMARQLGYGYTTYHEPREDQTRFVVKV